jgi:hypothetical protein
MKKHTITAIAITALALCAGASYAEDIAESVSTDNGGTSAESTTGSGVPTYPTPVLARLAGLVREHELQRWLAEQREARRMAAFYCSSGPAIQAALRSFFHVDVECPEATN